MDKKERMKKREKRELKEKRDWGRRILYLALYKFSSVLIAILV